MGFRRGHYDKHLCKTILILDEEEILSLNIYLVYSYVSPFLFSGAEPFVHIGRRHFKKDFYEFILRSCRLKIFLIYSYGDHFVLRRKTFCAILVEGFIRDTSMNLFCI